MEIEGQLSDREIMKRKAKDRTANLIQYAVFLLQVFSTEFVGFHIFLWHSLCLTIQVLSWDRRVEAEFQRELSGLG